MSEAKIVGEAPDGRILISVPKPPPCLPDPDSFDDLFVRLGRLSSDWYFEALIASNTTYKWIAVASKRNYEGTGHGSPGGLGAVLTGTGDTERLALRDLLEQVERAVGLKATTT